MKKLILLLFFAVISREVYYPDHERVYDVITYMGEPEVVWHIKVFETANGAKDYFDILPTSINDEITSTNPDVRYIGKWIVEFPKYRVPDIK